MCVCACVRVCGSKPRSHVRFTFVLAAITPVYSKKNLVVQHVCNITGYYKSRSAVVIYIVGQMNVSSCGYRM